MLVGAKLHVLIVALPVHDAVHSHQVSLLIAHEPENGFGVAFSVHTVVEPVLIGRQFSQSSPSKRALHEHDDLGLEAQSKNVRSRLLYRKLVSLPGETLNMAHQPLNNGAVVGGNVPLSCVLSRYLLRRQRVRRRSTREFQRTMRPDLTAD